jgi:hypothetical protein
MPNGGMGNRSSHSPVGNVQIRNCTLRSGYNGGNTLTIGGNFACENNSGGCFALGGKVGGNVHVDHNSNGSGAAAIVDSNTIVGNVLVDNNTAGSGNNNDVSGNTIGGNLQCARNTPGVSDANNGPNTVTGKKHGQCAGL